MVIVTWPCREVWSMSALYVVYWCYISNVCRNVDMTKWSLEEEMLKIVEEAVEGEANDMVSTC